MEHARELRERYQADPHRPRFILRRPCATVSPR